MVILQNELDNLINSLKRILSDDNLINIPDINKKEQLQSKSQSEFFIIDLNRQGTKVKRFTLQLRAQRFKDLPLLRLDLVGPSHSNPPGDFLYSDEIIPCPHIHIAKEGFGDRIAYPLNNETADLYLTNEQLEDFVQVTKTFLQKCNIINVEDLQISTTQQNFNL